MTGNRILAMIVKELWAVLRDPRGRIMLIGPPLIQLILFSAAATLEVKNVTIGVWNRDGGPASIEFVSQLAGSRNISRIVSIGSEGELRSAIDDQRLVAAVIFDQNFSRDVAARRPATVEAIFDGRRSNAAQIVAGYLGTIAANTGAAIRQAPAAGGRSIVAHWFNPNLDYLWFIMPSLVVTICSLSALSITVQSVARERELGTFDQLMVSPLRLHEILIGKMTPPFLIGLFNATVYLVVIPLFYGVPFTGSLLLFYLAAAASLLAIIGVGMAVSSIARTQQQAFLGMFLVTVPMTLLSGFAAPIDNMPPWLRLIAELNPQKHFQVISEGLFLKGMPAAAVFAELWPLLPIAAVTLGTSTFLFRSRME
jgi:ABC-2 type transport system permease protein